MDALNYDIIMEILSFTKYDELEKFCLINKKFYQFCNSNDLWNKMIARDFSFYPDNLPDAKKTYYKLYYFIDKYTLNIIAEFLTLRTKSLSLAKCYDTIFYILVEYIVGVDKVMDIEDEEEQKQYSDKLNLDIINDVFAALSVPIINVRNINSTTIYRYDSNDIRHTKRLAKILWDMINERIDSF